MNRGISVLVAVVASMLFTVMMVFGANNDFDGDGKSDLGCYYAPGGNWYIFKSIEGFYQTQFGYSGTTPITGDFDGDGITDFGCYYAPGGNWYIYQSTDGFRQIQFGYAGTVPIVGDFDGDGKDDIGCYYAPGGNWYRFMSTAGFSQTQFGYAGTDPVVGDFDGDGKDDIGCYYAPGGNWYRFMSTAGFSQTRFGYAKTIPIIGDFDDDGRDDFGTFDSILSIWFIFKSSEGFEECNQQNVAMGSYPFVGDFNGDGSDDIGTYDDITGKWLIIMNSGQPNTRRFTGSLVREELFGFAGTVPLGAPPSASNHRTMILNITDVSQYYHFTSIEIINTQSGEVRNLALQGEAPISIELPLGYYEMRYSYRGQYSEGDNEVTWHYYYDGSGSKPFNGDPSRSVSLQLTGGDRPNLATATSWDVTRKTTGGDTPKTMISDDSTKFRSDYTIPELTPPWIEKLP